MVKRLRHRPFTAVTRVRVSVGSPGKTALNGRFFVCSGGLAQLVRASALQAGGRWFKSDSLHHRSRKAPFAALRRSLRSVCVCACVCIYEFFRRRNNAPELAQNLCGALLYPAPNFFRRRNDAPDPAPHLFEAFLDTTKTLSERSNPRTKLSRRRNYAPLSQTFTGGEAAA